MSDIIRGMRALLGVLIVASACQSSKPAPPPRPAQAPVAPPVKSEEIAADSPRTTVEGNRFIAPGGWTITVRGPATILAPPEAGAWIGLVDGHARDAAAAGKAARAAY